MSTRRGNPYQYDDRPRSGTALRDRFGNRVPGEYSGVGADGLGIPLGAGPRATGLRTGTLDQGAHAEPSAFDARFGNRNQPTAQRPAAPAGPSPADAASTAIGAALAPVTGLANPLMGGAVAPTFHAPPPAPVAAPARPAAGAFSPAVTGLPSNPDDRALLMQTRARDAAAKQPAPISIPGGDPVARAWNTARGTGHPSTPEPGAPAAPAPAAAAFSPVNPYVVAAAGTGQVVKTSYGTASSTGGGQAATPAVWSDTGVTHAPAQFTATPTDTPTARAAFLARQPPVAPTPAPAVPSAAPTVPPPAPAAGAATPMATAPAAVPAPAAIPPVPSTGISAPRLSLGTGVSAPAPAAVLSAPSLPAVPPAPRPIANAGAFSPASAVIGQTDSDVARLQSEKDQKHNAGMQTLQQQFPPADDSLRPTARKYTRSSQI